MTTTETTQGWKFLRSGLRSNADDSAWTIGEWRDPIESVLICNSGYHHSPTPLDALWYVNGEILARTEARGKAEADGDKSCHAEMRIIEAWHWTKRDSVQLAIFAAELVIDLFEQRYPEDRRPRKAIEAAKQWAAGAAGAAEAAGAAGQAAEPGLVAGTTAS
jgi:hypothetical protein